MPTEKIMLLTVRIGEVCDCRVPHDTLYFPLCFITSDPGRDFVVSEILRDWQRRDNGAHAELLWVFVLDQIMVVSRSSMVRTVGKNTYSPRHPSLQIVPPPTTLETGVSDSIAM